MFRHHSFLALVLVGFMFPLLNADSAHAQILRCKRQQSNTCCSQKPAPDVSVGLSPAGGWYFVDYGLLGPGKWRGPYSSSSSCNRAMNEQCRFNDCGPCRYLSTDPRMITSVDQSTPVACASSVQHTEIIVSEGSILSSSVPASRSCFPYSCIVREGCTEPGCYCKPDFSGSIGGVCTPR